MRAADKCVVVGLAADSGEEEEFAPYCAHRAIARDGAGRAGVPLPVPVPQQQPQQPQQQQNPAAKCTPPPWLSAPRSPLPSWSHRTQPPPQAAASPPSCAG